MGEFDMNYDATRDRIFLLVKELHMSQKEFAQALDVNPQTVTDWKKGKSNSFMGKVGPISSVLHTSVPYLLLGSGERYSSHKDNENKQLAQMLAIEKANSQIADDINRNLVYAMQHILDIERSQSIQSGPSLQNDEKRPTDGEALPNCNVISVAGRDGSYTVKKLSDEQFAALKTLIDQLPELPENV